jgi:hypothetical protein
VSVKNVVKYDNSQRNGIGGRDYGEIEYGEWLVNHVGRVSVWSGGRCIQPVGAGPQEKGVKGNEVVEPETAGWGMLKVTVS